MAEEEQEEEEGEARDKRGSEPEAAIIRQSGHIRKQIDVDNVFLCFDLGGGAADCICYRLVNAVILSWKEIVPGDGMFVFILFPSRCLAFFSLSWCQQLYLFVRLTYSSSGVMYGAVLLDGAFESPLCEALASAGKKSLTNSQKANVMSNEWETNIKTSFSINSAVTEARFTYTYTANEYDGVRISKRELSQIFNNVTDKVMSLVEDQFAKVKLVTGSKPRAIIVIEDLGGVHSSKKRYGGGSTTTPAILSNAVALHATAMS